MNEDSDRTRLIAALSSMAESEQQGSRGEAAEAFAELSTPTLLAVHAAMPRLGLAMPQPASFFADIAVTHDWDAEDDILRALAFADLAEPGASSSEVLAFTKGLERYEDRFGGKDLAALEGRDLIVGRALVRLALAMANDLKWSSSPLNEWLAEPLSRYILDAELVALVAEHAERIEEIVEFVVSRESADPELLREYLERPRPLANGVL